MNNVIEEGEVNKSNLETSLQHIKVEKCIQDVNNGKSTIICAANENAIKAINQFKVNKIKANYKESRLPRMIIKNVSIDVGDKEIYDNIKGKNDLKAESIEIVTSIIKGEYKHVIIKVDTTTRNEIIKRKNYLYIGFQKCNVEDSIHIVQCFHCQKFGHKSLNCPEKEKEPICMYCNKEHLSKECKIKNDNSQMKCRNCGENHAANSKECIKYIQKVSYMIRNTAY